MSISWYSISIFSYNEETTIFNGYFSVDISNVIQTFYNANNIGVNILTVTGNDNGADYIFENNNFTAFGTSITSIPALDNQYNTSEWNLYTDYSGNNVSYKKFNHIWVDLGPNLYNFTFNSIPEPSCFNEGTKILCLNKNLEEEYIPIENLRKGFFVKSFKHGYRKIDLIGKNHMINNPEDFNICMYKMEKTETNGLLEDLIITGGHAILVDDLGNYKEENDKIFGGSTQIIDGKFLLISSISKDFIKLNNTNLYTYYHFVLENNGNDDERFGVWANGILTETPSKTYFTNCKYTLL